MRWRESSVEMNDGQTLQRDHDACLVPKHDAGATAKAAKQQSKAAAKQQRDQTTRPRPRAEIEIRQQAAGRYYRHAIVT